MPNINTTKDTLYYLLLPYSELEPEICLVKNYTAQDKESAASHFQNILNQINIALPYEKEEIIPHIKAEHELTETDKIEIKRKGILPDMNFSEADLML
jgi:hypothetical protein